MDFPKKTLSHAQIINAGDQIYFPPAILDNVLGNNILFWDMHMK